MERKIEFNVTGKERGKLAKAIGEFLRVEVRYLKVPTCNYDIGGSILDRNGVFIPAGGMSDSQVELLAEQFLAGGCNDRKSDEPGDALSISIPRETLSDSALYNLRKLIAGKETLFKHAFQTEKVDIMFDEEKVSFPWFRLTSEADEVKAYTEFVTKLCELARKQKRVSVKDRETDNEKYAFRCFLLRLGFIGDGSKQARKLLLKNLTGNSAFRNRQD